MSDVALISTIVIVQFTVLAGLVLYTAQRIERRIDGVERRIDRVEERIDRLEARFDRLEERLRSVEICLARLIGRSYGDDPQAFEGLGVALDAASAEASTATT